MPMHIKSNGKVQQNQVRHHVNCLTHSTPFSPEGTPLTRLLQSVAQPESTCGLCSGHRAQEDGQQVWPHQKTPAILRRKPPVNHGSTPRAWRRSGGLKIEVRNVIVAQLHCPRHMLSLTDTCGGYSTTCWTKQHYCNRTAPYRPSHIKMFAGIIQIIHGQLYMGW